jgi:hypothetical protein
MDGKIFEENLFPDTISTGPADDTAKNRKCGDAGVECV